MDFGHTLDIVQTSNFGLKVYLSHNKNKHTDLSQTSDKLLTKFRRQTPTSDFGPRPDFKHQTSDFGFLTLNFTLQI